MTIINYFDHSALWTMKHLRNINNLYFCFPTLLGRREYIFTYRLSTIHIHIPLILFGSTRTPLSLCGDVEIPLIKPMKCALIFLTLNDRFKLHAPTLLFSIPSTLLFVSCRLTLHMSSISSWERKTTRRG